MQVLTRTFTDFVLREARYEPGYSGSEHRHESPYLGCLIEGSFLERSPRGRTGYGPGSVHGHPAGDPHTGVVGPIGATCFSILPGNRIASRLESAGIAGDASKRVTMLAARCRRAFQGDDFASELDCETALADLLAEAFGTRGTHRKPRWLDDTRAFLHAHDQGPVTLAALSRVAGVHPVHVARAFRRTLGVTPAAYLRRLRFERACRALLETDVPLAELALSTGYASQSHLTRDFRARLDMTPSAYRRARQVHPVKDGTPRDL
jgi:AraC family transcriptional regulator